MLIQFIKRYHSDDDGGGSGAGDAGDVKPSDIINRYGKSEESALRLAERVSELENKLYRLREQKRELTRERDDLKAKLPADGAVVLAKDDADALEQYRAFGKPSEVKQALETKTTAEGELALLKREKLLAKAAELVGFKPSVLQRLAKDVQIEIKGTAEKPLAVVVADGTETALADYATKEWEEFLPSLQARAAQAPDINAGARSNGTGPHITDEERQAAQRRYSATF